MTTIAIRLDTQKLARRLRDKGFVEEQADAIVDTVRETSEATEKALESAFNEYRSTFKDDFAKLEASIKYDILKWMIPLILGLYALLISKLF